MTHDNYKTLRVTVDQYLSWKNYTENICEKITSGISALRHRIIMNMSNDVDYLVALDALDWKPLKTERIKAKSKLMFKLLNKMGPKSLIDLFTFDSEMTNYKRRYVESSLCLSQPRTNSLKKSFMFDGAHIWNSLPTNIYRSVLVT